MHLRCSCDKPGAVLLEKRLGDIAATAQGRRRWGLHLAERQGQSKG